MKKNSKNVRRLIGAAAIGLLLIGCKKDKLNEDERLAQIGDDFVINKIVAMGYNEEDIIELDDFYLVEGDILFSKDPANYDQTKQAHTHNLVSQTNVTSMTIFVNATIPTSGTDNWRAAVNAAINDLNGAGCSRVNFSLVASAGAADIIVRSDAGVLPNNVIASAGIPGGGQPFNSVLINLDFLGNMNVTEGQKRYNMVHELGHCIGLRHTNWAARGEPANPAGANHISGTSSNDSQSVMNGGTALNTWAGFSSGDVLAIETLYPLDWRYSSGGVSSWINLAYAGGIPLENLAFGDFNGDGKTDVFNINGSQWRYSSGGTSSWINLSSAGIALSSLRFGDFNGDGKTDVFHKSGSQWRYSSGGTSSWINLSSTSIPLSNLRFGDFNGDGKTDVFNVNGSQWRYSSGGTSSWINLSAAGIPIADLRFGDFNGDGKTDVFHKSGSQWRYSSGGTSSWINLSSAGVPLDDLRFADFNGDGKTDVFHKSGSQWRYSSGGASSWINLSSAGTPIEDLRFGDFNGDGKADVFAICGY